VVENRVFIGRLILLPIVGSILLGVALALALSVPVLRLYSLVYLNQSCFVLAFIPVTSTNCALGGVCHAPKSETKHRLTRCSLVRRQKVNASFDYAECQKIEPPSLRAANAARREITMPKFLKGAAIVLAVSAAALTSACMTNRDANNDRMSREMSDRDHGAAVVAVEFGNIGFGYSDGYWDNGHQWHQWANDGERQSYRNYQGNHYDDWNHDRDGDDGWHGN